MKYVKIEFEGDKAKVTYDVDNMAQLLTALLTLEGIIGRVSGLGSTEIREILDDEKKHVEVKPYDEDEVIDIEPQNPEA